MIFQRLLPALKGQQAESAACDYLQQQGLQLVARNFRCRTGEIDLIMQEQQCLVFIEVRYRHKKNYGSGAESITVSKRKKLLRTAEYYLLQQQLVDKITCRFDIIDISNHSQIEWIRDAFSYDSIR